MVKLKLKFIYKVKRGKSKKIWPETTLQYLRDNWSSMKMPELAETAGLGLTTCRSLCYQLGLKKMEMEYWTVEQISILINKYHIWGDKEIAEYFQNNFPKNKPWTIKHIEKKRKYMNLSRTPAEIKAIHKRNVSNGRFAMCSVKRWEKCGVAKQGEIRFQGRYPVIKINGKFIQWTRWAWQRENGDIPKGYVVTFIDGNSGNMSMNNLKLITRAELAKNNTGTKELTDNYIASTLTRKNPALRVIVKKDSDLINLKRTQLLLQREIKNASKK